MSSPASAFFAASIAIVKGVSSGAAHRLDLIPVRWKISSAVRPGKFAISSSLLRITEPKTQYGRDRPTTTLSVSGQPLARARLKACRLMQLKRYRAPFRSFPLDHLRQRVEPAGRFPRVLVLDRRR